MSRTKSQGKTVLMLMPIVISINLLSACTLRSDSSYSTKVSEIETAPAAEAILGTPNATNKNQAANSPPADLVEKLKTRLATELGIPVTAISLEETTPVQWNDACLGAPEPVEICAQVITPGYRIVLGAASVTYEFHTDQTGKAFRRSNNIPTSNIPSEKPGS